MDVAKIAEGVAEAVPIIREVVLDVEKLLSRFHLKHLNNEPASTGSTSLVDHMGDAVQEIAKVAGIKIVAPAPVEAAAEVVVKTALETALDKLETKAAAETIREHLTEQAVVDAKAPDAAPVVDAPKAVPSV